MFYQLAAVNVRNQSEIKHEIVQLVLKRTLVLRDKREAAPRALDNVIDSIAGLHAAVLEKNRSWVQDGDGLIMFTISFLPILGDPSGPTSRSE